jgi:hypothetical protein
MQKRHKRQIMFSFILVVMLVLAASGGVAFGKAHVPAGEIQVAHRGVVKQLPAAALGGHLRHGDIQLPACDFANVFPEGGDASNVLSSDLTGVTYTSGFVARVDAGGATPACPPGTF